MWQFDLKILSKKYKDGNSKTGLKITNLLKNMLSPLLLLIYFILS